MVRSYNALVIGVFAMNSGVWRDPKAYVLGGSEKGGTAGTEWRAKVETVGWSLSIDVSDIVRIKESSIDIADRTREVECSGCAEISKKANNCMTVVKVWYAQESTPKRTQLAYTRVSSIRLELRLASKAP